MKKTMWTVMALVAVLAMPALGQAAQTKPGAAKTAPAASTKPAPAMTAKAESHSATGVVKSMDDTSLVVAHKGKKESELTFVVDSSTKKEGTVAVGSSVTVKYHTDGGKNIATDIAAKAAPAKGASK